MAWWHRCTVCGDQDHQCTPTAKVCPDCGKDYVGDIDDDCCRECFNKFNGLTIDQMIESPSDQVSTSQDR